ncbi:ParB N-terminal domain-containing protein [Jannaschia sp. M317]|uniref:ParB N-terminal domain-containing protein n=1 Tax=Jannaschia sp. M317 TaxID=2867011 RepID=UPI0021A8F0D9|nr:ParB N-terminal domain-containing protein [Jannaschia sp. M317]UWQ19934.1 ParB N-terminal domain-containing protein [Jannaschia sp. M317]
MSRKRRMFDIDLPEDASPEIPEDREAKARRGPMATAIGEAGAAARHRAEVEADIRAENDALAHELVRLKKLGLVTDLIAVEAVRTTRLTRDRHLSDDLDLGDLKASLRDIGLSNPIRVAPDGQGGYELVQGLRRLTAYRELLAETGEDRWRVIPAGIMAQGETDAGLYRRMVDENLIRKDVSFAEMAQLARAYADEGVEGCADLDQAVNVLYASVAPQKRSYIRRFALVMARLDKVLDHPSAMSRAVGLALADRLEAEPDFAAEVRRALQAHPGRDAAREVAILRDLLAAQSAPVPEKGRGAPRGRRGRVALSVPVGPGVRATATQGKMELRADLDFGAVDRGRLERAIEAFWKEIDAG